MKNSRSLLLALSAVLISLTPALRADDQARPDGPPPGERRERMGDRMGEALGLSDDQKAQMKAIGDQERAEMQALRADTALAKEDRKAKVQVIHQKYKAQRDALLTPEQKVKADKFREKGRERMEKGGFGDGPGAERRKERREKSGN
jgi:Spy/CpxP family protein refolding chaperone